MTKVTLKLLIFKKSCTDVESHLEEKRWNIKKATLGIESMSVLLNKTVINYYGSYRHNKGKYNIPITLFIKFFQAKTWF